MKKVSILKLFIMLLLVGFFINGSVNAETIRYDDYISYKDNVDENGNTDGTICVVATKEDGVGFGNNSIVELEIPPQINGKIVTKVDGFAGCNNLVSVEIPSSVIEICDFAFEDCASLKNLTMGNGIKTIGIAAFFKCKSLTVLNLPDSVEIIKEWAFGNCEGISMVKLSDNLKGISEGAFYGCTSLNKVIFPTVMKSDDLYIESDYTLNIGIFEGCTSLKEINLPDNLKTLGKSIFKNSGITTIKLPKSLTKIESSAFYNCPGLTSIIIPDNVKIVESNAFARCPNLKEIHFPKYIEKIDETVFTRDPKDEDKDIKDTDIRRIKLYGYTGTVIQEFAKKFNLNFVSIEGILPFTDVKKGTWYYDSVKYVYDNNMVSGLTTTTFGPFTKLTRGMLVTILYRKEGMPESSADPKFTDVQDPSSYYYKAVNWATYKRVISGYGDGRFGPNDLITREQLAVMLNNYAKFKGKDMSKTSNLGGFKDIDEISSFALSSMKWAVGAGVITGNTDKTLNPTGYTTRAEAAAMLTKYCMFIGK